MQAMVPFGHFNLWVEVKDDLCPLDLPHYCKWLRFALPIDGRSTRPGLVCVFGRVGHPHLVFP